MQSLRFRLDFEISGDTLGMIRKRSGTFWIILILWCFVQHRSIAVAVNQHLQVIA